jgi:hypothetical protein
LAQGVLKGVGAKWMLGFPCAVVLRAEYPTMVVFGLNDEDAAGGQYYVINLGSAVFPRNDDIVVPQVVLVKTHE